MGMEKMTAFMQMEISNPLLQATVLAVNESIGGV
jgi:hypothetical protein